MNESGSHFREGYSLRNNAEPRRKNEIKEWFGAKIKSEIQSKFADAEYCEQFIAREQQINKYRKRKKSIALGIKPEKMTCTDTMACSLVSTLNSTLAVRCERGEQMNTFLIFFFSIEMNTA